MNGNNLLTQETPKYRPDIDGLRAVAVLIMIFYHAWPHLMPAAVVSVDVFFVISGYLITASVLEVLHAQKFRLKDFYFRRVRRIFPTLLVTLITTLGLGWVFLLPDEFHLLTKHTLASLGFSVNFVLWRESGYFDVASQSKPLLHLWTLSIEEQFYLLWPLVLLGSYTFFRKVVPTIATIVIISFVFFVTSHDYYFFTHARLWAIAAGGLIAALPPKKLPWQLSLAGLAALLLSFYFADFKAGHVFATVSTLTIILCGSVGTNYVNYRILAWRPLVYIGLISYPLYLWHWPLLSGARIITNNTVTDIQKLGLLLLAGILASMTYHLIELPVKKLRPARATMWLLPMALTLAAITAFLYESDLRPYRSVDRGELPLRKFDQRMSSDSKFQLRLLADRYKAPYYCHVYVPKQTFEVYHQAHADCLKTNPEKTNILVLGDSLAEEFHATLKLTHPEYHLLHFAGTSCLPIRALYQNQENDCAKLARIGFQYALDLPVEVVIFAAKWTKDYPLLLGDIQLLKARGKQVIVLGPSMVFNDDIPKVIARRSPDDSLVTLEKKASIPQLHVLNAQMKEWADANEILYIDKLSILCPDEKCRFISPEGIPYYRDNVHLLKDGVLFLGQGLRDQKILLYMVPPK